MMNITPDTRVSDIVAASPGTIRVFQRHGIEFCCGGQRPLRDFCAERQIPFDELRNELAAADDRNEAGEVDWSHAPFAELVRHILDAYHAPLRHELPRLEGMAEKVLRVFGSRYPALVPALHARLRHFRVMLERHMDTEEAVLFPQVLALEEAALGAPLARSRAVPLASEIADMEAEHQIVGEALGELRRITGNYQPPPDACATFRGLLHGLADLEKAMHLHVHLENNVLFPRAVRLDAAWRAHEENFSFSTGG